jgi:drug/metabolite transporter (DMT)-like permease
LRQLHGYLLIALVSVMWGSMGILQKLSYAYGIQPDTLIALRLSISSATLLFFVTLLRRESLSVSRRDLPLLLMFGIFAVAVQRVSYAYAVYLTTATMTAILFYTYPVFVTIFASFSLKEKITKREISAFVLAFLGVTLVVRAYDPSSLIINLLGIALGLTSSLCFVLYFLATKRLRSRYTSLTVTLYGDGIAALVLFPSIFVSFPQIAVFPPQLWILVLTIAWVLSLIGYLIYSYALKYVKSSKGSILSVLEPLSAALFSAALLGERLEIPQIVGIALALVAVALLSQMRETKT